MPEDLREVMLGMMSTLTTGIATLNETANELVRSSSLMDEPVTEAMRTVGRSHRVKVLELQGQLAALITRYVNRFGEEP